MKDGSAFLNDNAQTHRRRHDPRRRAASHRVSRRVRQARRLIDAGAKVAGGVEAGLRMAEVAMGGLGAFRLSWIARRTNGRSPSRCAPPSRCSPASARNMPAGTCPSEGYFAMGSGPARALARVEPLFAALDLSRQRVIGCACAGNRQAAAAAGRGEGRQGDRAGGRKADLPLCADAEPCRHRADRRARAGGRPAQGQRSRISVEKHRRGHRRGADPRAASGFSDRHGPDQRRHHLWRHRRSSSCSGPADAARELAQKLPSRARGTTAGLSPRFSSLSKATSTPSIRCCSAPPK